MIVKDMLTQDEYIEKGFGSHAFSFVTPVIFGAGVSSLVFIGMEQAAAFIAPFSLLILGAIVTSKSHMTNKRVILGANQVISYKKIESVKVNQSLLGRFFSYGTIRFIKNNGEVSQPVFGVRKPNEVATIIRSRLI